jgi:hypothetical protein
MQQLLHAQVQLKRRSKQGIIIEKTSSFLAGSQKSQGLSLLEKSVRSILSTVFCVLVLDVSVEPDAD